MKRLGWALSLVSLAGTVLAFAWLARDPSPGDLATVHGRLPELQGEAGCAQCHAERRDASDQACLRCHQDVATQRSSGAGVHAAARPAGKETCASCHGEHHGDGFAPVNDQSFRRAGIAVPTQFDHVRDAGLRFELTGRHQNLPCVACHGDAIAEPLPPGHKRFLGRTQECTGCHRDAHDGRLGPDCNACHGQERPFGQAARFAHDPRFPLADKHAGLACAQCHPAGPVAVVGAPLRGCEACHRNPHGPAADGTPPTRLPLARTSDCARCHDTRGFTGKQFGTAEHAARGVRLVGAHERATCVSCHAAGRPMSGAHTMDRCQSCHHNPHEPGAGGTAPRSMLIADASDCARCHDTERFATPPFGAAEHTRIGVLLDGAHGSAQCAGCHAPGRTFAVPRAEIMGFCVGCHADPHEPGGKAVRLVTQGRCAPCHETSRFRPARATNGDHVRMSGVPLAGMHVDLACATCHTGKRTERLRSLDTCQSCHESPHRRPLAGPRPCQPCHAESDPKLQAPHARMDLAEHARTGFPLTPPHATVACEACHGKPEQPWATRYPGRTPDQCALCHGNPHGRQFATGRFDPQDCTACHEPLRFSPPSFASARHEQTRFPLTGAHGAVGCDACHRPVAGSRRDRAQDRAAARVFTGTPRDCAGCHVDPHAGQFALDGGTDCSRCHGTQDFRVPRFDHRTTRFPLDADHGKLACNACHRPSGAGANATIRYKPLGITCQDCHDGRTKEGRRRG